MTCFVLWSLAFALSGALWFAIGRYLGWWVVGAMIVAGLGWTVWAALQIAGRRLW